MSFLGCISISFALKFDIKETQCEMIGTIWAIGPSLNIFFACAYFYSEAFVYKGHCIKRYLIPKYPLQIFKEI